MFIIFAGILKKHAMIDKIISVGVISIICATAVMAKDDQVTVESGNIAVLGQQVTAALEFDYSTMKVEGLPKAEYLSAQDDQYRADWPGVVAKSETYFAPMFHNYVKNGMKIDAAASPEYKIIVKIESLSLGNIGQMFNPFSGVKAGGGIISGKIYVVNLRTNKTECTISFKDIKSTSGPTEGQRWGTTYVDLNKAIGKLLKKA